MTPPRNHTQRPVVGPSSPGGAFTPWRTKGADSSTCTFRIVNRKHGSVSLLDSETRQEPLSGVAYRRSQFMANAIDCSGKRNGWHAPTEVADRTRRLLTAQPRMSSTPLETERTPAQINLSSKATSGASIRRAPAGCSKVVLSWASA
jgi:hypothetical protein